MAKQVWNNWNHIDQTVEGGGGEPTQDTYTKQEIDNMFTEEENQRVAGDATLLSDINDINEDLTAEKNIRESTDTNLQNQINTVKTDLQQEAQQRANDDNRIDQHLINLVGEINSYISTEMRNRETADTNLQNQIDTLNTNLQTEVTNRTNADDELNNNKQDKLVSGTNIKSINGQSVLGSGDLTVEAQYTETDTTLWSGSQGQASDITITLNDNINKYKYLKFYSLKSTNWMIDKVSVSDINESSTDKQIILENGWDSNLRYIRFYKKSNTELLLENIVDTTIVKIVGVKVTPIPELTVTPKLFLGVANLTQAQGSKTITITLDDGYVLTGASCSSEGNIFTNYISTITRDSSDPQKYNFLCWYDGANSGNQLRVTAYAIKLN